MTPFQKGYDDSFVKPRVLASLNKSNFTYWCIFNNFSK